MTQQRHHRAAVAEAIAADHGGVVHRGLLRAAGVDRDGVRTELRSGRWSTLGRHTVAIGLPRITTDVGRWWWAVWESGSGAVLDGITALQAGGLSGFREHTLHVQVPPPHTCYRHRGVRVHRRRTTGPIISTGAPRARPDWAAIRGAQWAVSDRQAALIVAMSVQQRLVDAARLRDSWTHVTRSPRRKFLDLVVGDVCDGAHSLGELDFAGLCRSYGLPQPRRQSLREGRSGRLYLDVEFDGGVVVEIDGGHHQLGLAPMDDALRANEVTLGGSRVLRIPLLGLRLAPDAFMEQVARALGHRSARQKRSNAPGPAERSAEQAGQRVV